MAIVYLFIAIPLVLLVGALALYVANLHWWKVSLIASILFTAVAMLWMPGSQGWTPNERLKGGIDLVGGTTLVYDVTVPPGQIPGDVIDQTIEILSERIDPKGTMNLIWRQVAGGRLEVQMAAAGENVREARDNYDDTRTALTADNITPGMLNRALDSDDRNAEFDKIAGDNSGLLDDLKELGHLFDGREDSNNAYVEAQADYNQYTLEELADHPGVVEALNRTEVFAIESRDHFEDAEREIRKNNFFNPSLFDFLVALPPIELNEKQIEAGETTPREDRLAVLKDEFPGRADRLQAAYDALVAYEAVKGPLDDPNDLIRLLAGSGVLEFRIAADPAVGHFDHIARLDDKGPNAGGGLDFRWFVVDDLNEFVKDDERRTRIETLLRGSLSTDSALAQQARDDVASILEASNGVVARPYAGVLYVLLHDEPGFAMTREDDWSVTTVGRGTSQLGKPTVNFELDGRGSMLMSDMTGPNEQRPMAVLLDGAILTAPNINERLSTNIQISGDFSAAEVKYLINTMNAGSLEGQLSERPVSIERTGPQLGAANLKAGLQASMIALIAVAIFMVLYYFFGGLVANFALAANLVLILGVMAMIQSTFTLPGIAGMVLTIGMAVDANVLIFERIREELARKAPLEVAVRQGYAKALSTILDANITTLITCVILGYTATSEIKGFAVVLGIGILATLFTALFCTRTIIDLYVRYSGAKSLSMLPIAVPGLSNILHPNVNWIRLSRFIVPFSVLLIVLGFIEIGARGKDMLDIEFRSGTKVGFTLAASGENDEDGDPLLLTLPTAEVEDRVNLFGQVAESIQEGRSQADVGEQLSAIRKVIGDDAPSADEIYGLVETVVSQARVSYDARVAEVEKKREVEADLPDAEPMIDYALFDADNLVTLGEVEPGSDPSGWKVAMLITDHAGVTALLKVAFDDVLEATPEVSFDGQDKDAGEAADYVRAINTTQFGPIFDDRWSLEDDAESDISDFRGGVAMVVDNMAPALSVPQLKARIDRMRRQPPHDALGARTYQVIGLERGDDGSFDDAGNILFKSVAVVVWDGETNYEENPDTLGSSGGLASTEWKLLHDALTQETSFNDVTVFNSQVSGTMQQTALVSMLLSLLAVVAYIWLRFGSVRYGLAAIAALVHDVAITMGLIALAGWAYDKLGPESPISTMLLLDPFKVNLAIVAALLTIVGYSLNDTIVVFDRIRENRGRLARATPDIINDSINQTISRTMLTSMTTFLAVAVLYVMGGPGIHGFAFAMVVGVLAGTYSSIAIASPILVFGTKGQGPSGGPVKKVVADPIPESDPPQIGEVSVG